MGDGTATGLVSAEEMKREAERQRAQAEERRRGAVGRGAETVYRDKDTGAALSREEYLQKQKDKEDEKRRKKSIYDEDQYLEWRGGLAQKKQADQRAKEMVEEAAKPFARSADDNTEWDSEMRSRVRFGDPFAHLAFKAVGGPGGPVEELTAKYDASALNQSGFKVPQGVPPHSWLKRGVAAPANRYNLRPGRHWDGVDRSNGFEREYFRTVNTKAAQEAEARLWAMGDM